MTDEVIFNNYVLNEHILNFYVKIFFIIFRTDLKKKIGVILKVLTEIFLRGF